MTVLLEGLIQGIRDEGLDASPEQLLDILWLAARLGDLPSPSRRARQPSATIARDGESVVEPPGPVVLPPLSRRPGHGQGDDVDDDAADRPGAGRAARGVVRLVDATEVDGPTILVRPFDEPSGPELPGKLQLARALRPLRRRVPSRIRQQVDAARTVHLIAATILSMTPAPEARPGLPWSPVLRPEPERWLSLELVVDKGGSMGVWRPAIRELHALSRRLGAFRRIRVWSFNADAPPPAAAGPIDPGAAILPIYAGLRPWRGEAIAHRPKELVDPTQRTLVLVVTDGVGRAWRDGRAARTLSVWAEGGKIALIQTLPESLWRRTAFGTGEFYRLRAPSTTGPRARPIAEPVDPDRATGPTAAATPPIPVATLEPGSLGRLACHLAGGMIVVPGVALATSPGATVQDHLEDGQRLVRFLRGASPGAVQLARLLAASLVITLPVMRKIRGTMLPGTGPILEAEVLLSGILAAPGLADDPDDVRYEFPGAVRSRLLDALPMLEAARVLEGSSFDVAESPGQVLRLPSILSDRRTNSHSLRDDGGPYAKIAVEILDRLGGDYAGLIDRSDRVVGRRAPAKQHPGSRPRGAPAARGVSSITAKVVLVGDVGVGKTGLGWLLAHGEFKEHASTHGQQFWLLNQFRHRRRDGAQCDAILWDLAGQSDYRLVNALFLDDADLALVLFDPTRSDDPLQGVEFWLKQLNVGDSASGGSRAPKGGTPTLLVAARADRGTPRLTQDELEAFCKKRGIAGYLSTSAKEGVGIDQLVQRMQALIPWDDKPATVTTETIKRIKDNILGLKENRKRRKVILTPDELRQRLAATDRRWKFTDAEMLTAVGNLANYGFVTSLTTSRGETRILLAPELLNNLAASFVLEARRNPKGLGTLEEERLLSGGYAFPELEKLPDTERDILLESAAGLFLEHNVCFRETDPVNARGYLIFPELIKLKRPLEDDATPVEDSVAYTVSGAVENVYASLLVLLGYTPAFTRTSQWRNHARYEVGNGLVCGFRLEEDRDGELDFVLYFGTNVDVPVRMLFQSLFESFLARRNISLRRFEPVSCSKGHPLNRTMVREQMTGGADFAFCPRCGEKIVLPKADRPIQLSKRQTADVEAQRRAADQRSRFEQVLFRLKTYVREEKIAVPDCFISYAWGNPEHERWVERSLATDLLKAGITVVLDRWENARIGASLARFVERVSACDCVIVVGTPSYRAKYEDEDPVRGYLVVTEGDLIDRRMIGTQAQKASVLPVLLEGTKETAFPPLLHSRVYADFRRSEAYFDSALHLILSLYGISPRDPVAIGLRESLQGSNA